MQIAPITIPFVIRAQPSSFLPFIEAIYEVNMVSNLSELEETSGEIEFVGKSAEGPVIKVVFRERKRIYLSFSRDSGKGLDKRSSSIFFTG